MLNYLWAGMIFIGISYAAVTGRMPEITDAAINSSKEAITLCITMMGVMSFWVGLMEIAERSGMIHNISKRLHPFIHFLFPELPQNHPAQAHITTNILAITFIGISCKEEILRIRKVHISLLAVPCFLTGPGIFPNRRSSSNVFNDSIAFKPAGIAGAGILATAVSTFAAIFYCKIWTHQKHKLEKL